VYNNFAICKKSSNKSDLGQSTATNSDRDSYISSKLAIISSS
jgi:hypothetical protein